MFAANASIVAEVLIVAGDLDFEVDVGRISSNDGVRENQILQFHHHD